MGPVAISFGLATAAVVGLGFLAARKDAGLSAAAGVVLALGWTAGQFSERIVGWELTPDSYATIDVVSAFAVALLYARSEARWLIALALVFMAQSGLHLIYQGAGRVPGGINAYLFGLNILYGFSLMLVAYGGRGAADVLSALGRRLLSSNRDGRGDCGSHSPQGAGARPRGETYRLAGTKKRLGHSVPEASCGLDFSEPCARHKGTSDYGR